MSFYFLKFLGLKGEKLNIRGTLSIAESSQEKGEFIQVTFTEWQASNQFTKQISLATSSTILIDNFLKCNSQNCIQRNGSLRLSSGLRSY